MPRVLLVDDEPALLFTLSQLLKSRGLEPVLAHSAKEALAKLDGVDGVVTDYSMPDMDGVQLVQAVHERDESLPVVMLTAHGSERVAVRAMKSGAYEYVTKPFDIDEISLVIDRALEARSLRVQNRRLTAEKALGRAIIGDSPAMRRVLDAVNRVGPKDITVLVRGDTGTGKELIASLIHAESRRASRPLVRFNCAAIPGELAEAELFGHTRGAFTGAAQARRGFFAEANGGTLVLDEVGELSAPVQAKLLRALQEGEIQPVGAGRVEKVDVRVVACTNRDLAEEARAHRFREDLYYRLAVVELLPGCSTSMPRTSRPWPRNSRAAMPSGSGCRTCGLRPIWSWRSGARNGQGTSGSSRTPSRGWWRSAAGERSPWRHSREPPPGSPSRARSRCRTGR